MEFEKRGDHIGVFHNAVSEDMINQIHGNWDYYEEMGHLDNRKDYDTSSSLEKEDSSYLLGRLAGAMAIHEPCKEHQVRWERERDFFNVLNEDVFPVYQEAYGMREEIRIASVDGKMQKTEKGQGFHIWHYESDSNFTRHRVLAWMLYMNDVEEGGETEFLYQHCRFKPTRGTLLVWPGGHTHMHRGNPPLSNTKYILTGWGEYVT